MRSAPVGAVAVAWLLLVAGCNGFGESTTDRDPYDVAPRTTSPEPTTVTGEPIAPGLREGGITSSVALSDAHYDGLANRSYRYERRIVYRFPNGSVYRESRRRVWIDGAAYYSTYTAAAPGEPSETLSEAWSNGTISARRWRVASQVRYRVEPPDTTRLRREVTERDRIRRLLSLAGEVSVTPIPSSSGPQRYRVRVTSFESDAVVFETAPGAVADDPAMVAVVDGRGVVRRLELSFSTRYRGRRFRVSDTLRYELGPVSIPRPDWIDEARRAAGDGTTDSVG